MKRRGKIIICTTTNTDCWEWQGSRNSDDYSTYKCEKSLEACRINMSRIVDLKTSVENKAMSVIDPLNELEKYIVYKYLRSQGYTTEGIDHKIQRLLEEQCK